MKNPTQPPSGWVRFVPMGMQGCSSSVVIPWNSEGRHVPAGRRNGEDQCPPLARASATPDRSCRGGPLSRDFPLQPALELGKTAEHVLSSACLIAAPGITPWE